MSKEYRQFLKQARLCKHFLSDDDEQSESDPESNGYSSASRESRAELDKLDHAYNGLIGLLANNQFTAQTLLAQSYKQLGPREFLDLSRLLARHGFWGRLITWAFLYVKEDSHKLRSLLEAQDTTLAQSVNDEAEMFELFNSSVQCQRVNWQ
ncbi:hypothetical protein BG004_005400, partial [Podila humilis]